MPKFGRFPWENTVVAAQSAGNRRPWLMGMEDGPAVLNPKSRYQLYMYVGHQGADAQRRPRCARNGLDNGKMYVFISCGRRHDEPVFGSGKIKVKWAQIPR